MDVSLLVFKAACFRGWSQVQILKVGTPNVGSQPLAPQGETPSFEFSPHRESLRWGWDFWRDCVPGLPPAVTRAFGVCVSLS